MFGGGGGHRRKVYQDGAYQQSVGAARDRGSQDARPGSGDGDLFPGMLARIDGQAWLAETH